MNVIMIVPTGIGAEIGGHAGDANPVVKLLGAVSDKIITHPNVVNASDINEMPANCLYVDGYMLDKFLAGEIELREVHSNKILVVTNSPVQPETINAVSAARATLGIDIEMLVLDTPLELIAEYDPDGSATGEVLGWEELVEQVSNYQFDALAIATPIKADESVALKYFRDSGVNPWGGIEAKASRLVSSEIPKPVAHAPVESGLLKTFNEVTDPRIAAEIVSVAYLHCVLKGLSKAPRVGRGIGKGDIDFLISPHGCFGHPHRECLNAGIPVIVVKENRTIYDTTVDGAIYVENYLEAAGVIACATAGVIPESVTRPLAGTKIVTAHA